MSNKMVSMLWRAGAILRRGCALTRREGLLLLMPRWGCVAAVLLLLSPLEASNWNVPPGQIGDWSVAANWTGGLPTSSSTVNVSNGGTVTVTLPGAVYANLALSNGWVQMSDGTLTGGSPTVTNQGSFIQSGGIHTAGGTVSLNCNYTLSGAGLLTAKNVQMGGSGAFTQTGGTNNITNSLSIRAGSQYYYLSGSGRLSAATEYVSSGAIMLQAGGVNTVTQLWLAQSGTATYDLRAGALSATSEYIGYYPQDTGMFKHSGGSNTVGTLRVGYDASGTG